MYRFKQIFTQNTTHNYVQQVGPSCSKLKHRQKNIQVKLLIQFERGFDEPRDFKDGEHACNTPCVVWVNI